ncbi:hypothetical protein HWV62_14332 [Athelia sp. TMB]|nr:hypothetical protein HWV62_14332 [Athelia sp. TMB]
MPSPWSWTPDPATPNTWTRALWGGEILFAHATREEPGRGDGMPSCTIRVPATHPLTHAHVRRAMRQLRWDHPSVASTVTWETGAPAFVYASPPSEAAVDAWLDCVVFERAPRAGQSVDAALDELRSELGRADAPRGPHELLLYHVPGPGYHGLLIYEHHTLFDGLAVWQVLSAILANVAAALGRAPCTPLNWGEEHARLARALPDRTANTFEPQDMEREWPLVERMRDVLTRPSTSFGLPTPHPDAPLGATAWFRREYPASVRRGLNAAGRAAGARAFALQFAMVLIACLRVSPPAALNANGEHQEHCVSMPVNPVNLRAQLSVLAPHAVEIVSAIGFKALEARDLLRFANADTRRAVYALAREVQAQSDAQEGWVGDVARCAPAAMKMLGEYIFAHPPSAHPLKVFGMTNFGVLDDVVGASYPIPAPLPSPASPASPAPTPALEVTALYFHSVMFTRPRTLLPLILHAWTWRGVLTHAWGFSPAHMGAVDERRLGSQFAGGVGGGVAGGGAREGEAGEEGVLEGFVRELERIMLVVAEGEAASPHTRL